MTPVLSPSFDESAQGGAWFLRSGIQQPNGGVARYYYSDKQENAPISTEITGYGISALCYLYERTGQAEYLAAAERAAAFLVDHAWHPSARAFPFELQERSPGAGLHTYFFDTGIIIRGLLTLVQTGRSEYAAKVAVEAGLSMWRDFACEDGFHPILKLSGKEPVERTSQWSRSPGCYQLKSAMAWWDLYELTGDSQFASWYRIATEHALRQQAAFLPAETPEKTMDRLHAYCYFLEGLLPCTSGAAYADAIRAGIEQVSTYLREIGPKFERSDVYAQLLRVRLFASQDFGVRLDREAAEDELRAIRSFQVPPSASPDCAGGFWFGRKGGAMLPFVNPVSTAFCVQAIEMWRDFGAGKPLLRRSLV